MDQGVHHVLTEVLLHDRRLRYSTAELQPGPSGQMLYMHLKYSITACCAVLARHGTTRSCERNGVMKVLVLSG
jgi:hypothetical protein